MQRTTVSPAVTQARATIALAGVAAVLSIVVDALAGGIDTTSAAGRVIAGFLLGLILIVADLRLPARLREAGPPPRDAEVRTAPTLGFPVFVLVVAVVLPLVEDGLSLWLVGVLAGVCVVVAREIALLRRRERRGGTVLQHGRSFFIAD